MHARLRLLLSLLAVLAAPLWAQDDPKFNLSAKFEPATAAPGATVTLVLAATTEPGWHAYGTLETTNIPVSLDASSLETGGLEVVGEPEIPPGIPHATPIGTAYPLDEHFEVKLKMKVPAGASGTIELKGELGYQICDATMCERPNSMPFAAKLTIGAGGQEPEGQKPEGQDPGAEPAAPDLGFKPPLFLEQEGEVAVRARFEPEAARAGEVTTLVLEVSVADGWHAYGAKETVNVPVAFDHSKQEFGALELEGDAQVPPGEPHETPGVGTQYPLPREFEVRQVVRVPEGTAAGDVAVRGVFDYQVCDDVPNCLPPADVSFEAKLKVEAGEAREGHLEAAQDGAEGGAEAAPVDDDDPAGSWWGLILLCIGGGLFALAMPCTYPMIPITFSFFMKQAEKRGGNVLPLTIVYGLGIIAMFVVVGVALAEVIIPFVNHWATNALIGVFFFFFAFVLFGWVNLNPPQWMNKLAMKAQSSAMKDTDSGGFLSIATALGGVFFMGATLVITSFTCTAPIVGSLIARVAELGSTRVAIGMGVFGLTMAIPFMVLSLMPTKVKAMPKSGEWMDTLKISLGFIELAAAFKFVSMVDFAFGWQIMPRELFLMLWAAIFGMWALFLFGILRKAGTVNEGVSNGRMATGMFATLLSAYFLFGALGNRLDPLMNSFAPAYSNSLVKKGGGEKHGHEVVYDDPDRATAMARSQGKLVLYNFTGFN